MILDRIENLGQYTCMATYREQIEEFIKLCKETKLERGKYDIVGDDLFALVQTYETRECEEGKMESHKKYIDLQYVEKGSELMHWSPVEGLEVEEVYEADKDVMFYKKQKAYAEIPLKEGLFVCFFPEDAHMLGAMYETKQEIDKIVFKIRVK